MSSEGAQIDIQLRLYEDGDEPVLHSTGGFPRRFAEEVLQKGSPLQASPFTPQSSLTSGLRHLVRRQPHVSQLTQHASIPAEACIVDQSAGDSKPSTSGGRSEHPRTLQVETAPGSSNARQDNASGRPRLSDQLSKASTLFATETGTGGAQDKAAPSAFESDDHAGKIDHILAEMEKAEAQQDEEGIEASAYEVLSEEDDYVRDESDE